VRELLATAAPGAAAVTGLRCAAWAGSGNTSYLTFTATSLEELDVAGEKLSAIARDSAAMRAEHNESETDTIIRTIARIGEGHTKYMYVTRGPAQLAHQPEAALAMMEVGDRLATYAGVASTAVASTVVGRYGELSLLAGFDTMADFESALTMVATDPEMAGLIAQTANVMEPGGLGTTELVRLLS
jgi:hypothetical protein